MNKISKKIIAVLICVIGTNFSFAQLSVNNGVTPTFMVTNVLLGTGVTASGITYTGGVTARGTFNGTTSNIGFPGGIVLATGDIATAIGPNTLGSAGSPLSQPGDPDLDAVSANTTFDAAVLEFDFVPMSDTVKFNYVFASEEYLEFCFLGVNDAFGFFISGPGIAGPFTGGADNCALVPGTATPVTIDNVNTTNNPSFYFNNETPPGATVQYDGFTVPMQAIHAVQCGQTYHIKIAIADAGDGVYDSGVFLDAGSFSSQGVQIIPNISYGGSNDSTLYEGCGLACIDFIRTSNLAAADTITVNISGTATNAVDYNTGVPGTPLPTTLIFAPGQDTLEYCINAVADATLEGTESIILQIIQSGSCVNDTTEAHLYVTEHDPLVLIVTDTAFCNSGGTATLFCTVAGGVQPYTYTWSGGLPSTQSNVVTVSTTTTYTVTLSDACTGAPDPTPSVTDTATITVATVAPIVLDAGDDLVVCPGDIVNLVSTISGGLSPFIYNWSTITGADTVFSANASTTPITANTGGIYSIAVVDACGNTGSDQVMITVEGSCALNIPNIITPDGQGPTQNETFFVENLDKFPGSSLKIYNRWGNKIYESADYKNDWNGNGHSEGTYYYVLTVLAAHTMQANANKPSTDGGSFTTGSDDIAKVFAGFFQLSTLK